MKIDFKRHRRSKNIKISVKADGNVLVTFPFWASKKSAMNFVKEKESWIRNYLEKMKDEKNQSILSMGGRKDYLEKKEIARKMIEKKIEKFNEYYGFEFGRIAIRNQKSRWGSCSSKKNLNFNYRIVYLSEDLADYLVVHELCHLKEMNHSKRFWNLVEATIFDYRKKTKMLRKFS